MNTGSAKWLGNAGNVAGDYGLAVLRIVVGTTFFLHGWQKVFDTGVGNVAGFFGSLGVPAPAVAATVVSGLELVGGLLLMIGLLTRWVSIPLAAIMGVAAVLVHLPNGFFVGNGGVELVLVLGAGAVALALAGPGALAVDRFLGRPAAAAQVASKAAAEEREEDRAAA